MNTTEIIDYFYPEDTQLKRLLLLHSTQVRDKAISILEMEANAGLTIDKNLVIDGAMLHDIGIIECHAPSIFCEGEKPYIAHGTIGGEMLRKYGEKFDIDLEKCARICERHTGSGLTAKEIREQGLPLPEIDLLPEALEEKLICLADKFFSKSGNHLEKSKEKARNSLMKFGNDTIERFDNMCRIFNI